MTTRLTIATAARHKKNPVELLLERTLFASRWLMASFYLGLVVALTALLFTFGKELLHELVPIFTGHAGPEDAILIALSLIDLSLAADLLLIVTFSGYENFASKIDTRGNEDRPSWMGTVDFSGLQMKLIASIVAISAISLLRSFMRLSEPGTAIDAERLTWLITIYMTFVGSGVVLALMDWIASTVEAH